MSSGSSSKRGVVAANRREAVQNDLLWYLTFFKEIRYYAWSLTLCRIGHKPLVNLQYQPFSAQAIAHLRCSRCRRQLAVQTLSIGEISARNSK